eukprot:gnl/TRDRNA2_/TRDRNA2_120258_c2_seq1.p1 gnl/TRDRNA2_/TRDRNA2_120258_c2~~gnl/TRDRNA2_/TRDRNA2_120258_c2_seq1.p1  ORF type:complete len:173 (+),score=26.48 gnl/TRDRNA2_/TRDRNA2_120258_c2_seq1:76-519(+)
MGQVVICGGQDMCGRPQSSLETVELFDPMTGIWSPGPKMCTPRCMAAAASISGQVYVFGGSSDGGRSHMCSAERLNLQFGLWEPLLPMSHGRKLFSAGMVRGKIYVFGGDDGQLSAECFDPGTMEWQELPPLLQARSGAAAASAPLV